MGISLAVYDQYVGTLRHNLSLIDTAFGLPVLPSFLTDRLHIPVKKIPQSRLGGPGHIGISAKTGIEIAVVSSSQDDTWSEDEEATIGHELAHFLAWKKTNRFFPGGSEGYWWFERYCEAFAAILLQPVNLSGFTSHSLNGQYLHGAVAQKTLGKAIRELCPSTLTYA